MKNFPSFLFLAAGPLVLTACGQDKPAPVVRETRVIYRDREPSRPSAPGKPAATPSNNPDNFEPVERPASYSR